MGWTASDPPRFIDEKRVTSLIRQVSELRLKELEFARPWIETDDLVSSEFRNLSAAAHMVLQGCPSGEESLKTALFTDDALSLLLKKCRNRYWMWYLLSRIETSCYPVDSLAIARAHARSKDSLYDNRHGFAFVSPAGVYHEMRGMPLGFTLEMWHRGQILARNRSGGDGFEVMLNPLLIDD